MKRDDGVIEIKLSLSTSRRVVSSNFNHSSNDEEHFIIHIYILYNLKSTRKMFVYTFPKKESINLNLKKNCNTTHIIHDIFHLYVHDRFRNEFKE